MNIFANLINNRKLKADSSYATLHPFFLLFLLFLIYIVMYVKTVINYLNRKNGNKQNTDGSVQ